MNFVWLTHFARCIITGKLNLFQKYATVVKTFKTILFTNFRQIIQSYIYNRFSLFSKSQIDNYVFAILGQPSQLIRAYVQSKGTSLTV